MQTIIQVSQGSWTALTNPGESGVICFDSDVPESTSVRVYHTPEVIDGVTPEMGLRLKPRAFNDDFLTISADSHYDVFYATCARVGESADIFVDVIS